MSSPTNPQVVKLLKQGLNHYGLGDLDAAIAAWEEARALDPEHQAVRDYLETAYEELGERPRAAVPAPGPEIPVAVGEDDDTPRSLPAIESEPARITADPVIASEAQPAIPIDREEDTLVRGALDAYREGRLEKAWEDLDRAAQLDPERLDLRAYQELIRNQLMSQWAREIGDQGRVARLKVELNDLMGRDLQPDEGFLVSQIDGALALGDLINLSALDRFRTFEILARLIRDGIIE